MYLWSYVGLVLLHFTLETKFFLFCICMPEGSCRRVCACMYFTKAHKTASWGSPRGLSLGYRWPLQAILPTSSCSAIHNPSEHTCFLCATAVAPGTSARTCGWPFTDVFKPPKPTQNPVASGFAVSVSRSSLETSGIYPCQRGKAPTSSQQLAPAHGVHSSPG